MVRPDFYVYGCAADKAQLDALAVDLLTALSGAAR